MITGSHVKNFFIIVAKNAVNAVLTNSSLMALMHGTFNTYSRDGLWNIGKATLAVVAAREAMVWGPVIVRWSMTNASPDDLQKSLDTAAAENVKVGQAIQDAKIQAPAPAAAPAPQPHFLADTPPIVPPKKGLKW